MIVYGPVPSWRLGNSLGVDLIEPPNNQNKLCSFDCLYCQLGKNTTKTITPRKLGISENDLEILRKRIAESGPDYITFSGKGEPTLNLDLGAIAKRIKKITNIPIAVLTNASLVDNPEVRKNLDCCDLVIAKIDAPNQEMFEKINRPYEDRPFGSISLDNIIKGIKLLKTNVAIQTLLFSSNSITNTDDLTITKMINIYKNINQAKPISIFLGTAYRPSINKNIMPLSIEELKKVALRINAETKIKVTYYKKKIHKKVSRQVRNNELKSEIINLLSRRPCTEDEIMSMFGNSDIPNVLYSLMKEGIIKRNTKNNMRFMLSDKR